MDGRTRRVALAALAFAVAAALPGCGGSGRTTNGPSDGSVAAAVATRLATLESKGPPSAALARKFDSQIKGLVAKCREPPKAIGYFAMTAQKKIGVSGTGQSQSLLSIISHVNAALPASAARVSCAGVFAHYVIVLKGATTGKTTSVG